MATKKAAKGAAKAQKDGAVSGDTRVPQATKIAPLPKHMGERPSFNRFGEKVDDGLDEARHPVYKIHRPHQERNPEREADDAQLGTGATV